MAIAGTKVIWQFRGDTQRAATTILCRFHLVQLQTLHHTLGVSLWEPLASRPTCMRAHGFPMAVSPAASFSISLEPRLELGEVAGEKADVAFLGARKGMLLLTLVLILKLCVCVNLRGDFEGDVVEIWARMRPLGTPMGPLEPYGSLGKMILLIFVHALYCSFGSRDPSHWIPDKTSLQIA